MARSKHHKFTQFTPEGKEFIKMWNRAYKDGIQPKLAKHFKMSPSTVVRIRRQLKLLKLTDPKHPGIVASNKRIKKLYLKEERSTLQIANIFRMNAQGINKRLQKMGIKLRPQHVINCKYFKTRSKLSPSQLLEKIKELYIDKELNCKAIGNRLHIDQGTVSNKLKAMNIKVVRRWRTTERYSILPNLNIKAIYKGLEEPYKAFHVPTAFGVVEVKPNPRGRKVKCYWCGKLYNRYILVGPKKQKYCCSSCKNRAKDVRRLLKNKSNPKRLNKLISDIKQTWGSQFPKAYDKIIKVKSIIINT